MLHSSLPSRLVTKLVTKSISLEVIMASHYDREKHGRLEEVVRWDCQYCD
jgi:hypothetical protein